MQIIRSLGKVAIAVVDVALLVALLTGPVVLLGLVAFDQSRSVFSAYYTQYLPIEFPWH